MRSVLKNGDEVDALSRRWKNMLRWRAGERKKIKRRVNRRIRKDWKYER